LIIFDLRGVLMKDDSALPSVKTLSQAFGLTPTSVLGTVNRFGVSAGRWVNREGGQGISPPFADCRLVVSHVRLDRFDVSGDGIQGRSGPSAANAIRIVPIGESVKWAWTADAARMSIVFIPPAAIKMVTDDLWRGSGAVALRDPMLNFANPFVAAIVDELLNEKTRGHNALHTEQLTLTLISTLVNYYAESSRSFSPTGTLSRARVRLATEFMELSLTRDISLVELAEVTGLSVFHFARAFKKTTGESVYRYFTSMRIAKAQSLMRSRAQNLTEIAMTLGYASQSAFSTAFKRTTGFTPSEWRKRMTEGG
jgi:AraC family transcriptional regulator